MAAPSMTSKDHGDRYVTNRELASELRSFRWEVRFLILMAGMANMGLLFGLKPNLVVTAAGYVARLVT